jgi:hypothetical protein
MGDRMKPLVVLSALLVLAFPAEARQVRFVCGMGGESTLTFDFDKKVMFHQGEADDTYPIIRADKTVIAWKGRNGAVQTAGSINRVSMSGDELLTGSVMTLDGRRPDWNKVTVKNTYDRCRIGRGKF